METMETDGGIPRTSSGSDDSEDSSDWKEFDTDEESDHTACLFCSQKYRTTLEAISHCSIDHDFDLEKLKARFNMDCYGYIKLVNYIHTNRPEASAVMSATEPAWEDELYMKPVVADDPWLMYDFDDIEVPPPAVVSGSPSGGFHVNAEDGRVTLSEQHFAELQRTIQQLVNQVREKEAEIDVLKENMEKMKQVTQELVCGSGDDVTPLSHCVKDIRVEDDEEYFNTYSHFSIHHEMLSDQVRTSSYRDAIIQNAESWKGKTILDLGCGTGILSMFAASSGAEKIIAIDQSEIVYHAMDIIRENNLADKIEIIKGRIEDTKLSQERVDVIISEWMGYFLLFEGMLDSLIYTRDHHLIQGGKLLPNRCNISLVGVDDKARHENLVGFWKDVYGYRMTCLQHEVVREATVEIVPKDKVVTTSCVLTELDLYTCTTNSVNFSSKFNLEVTTDGSLTALAGYFDVFFDIPNPVSFSTGPHAEPTHWKQSVFLFEEPFVVKKGDTISGQLVCQRNLKDVRSLVITFTLLGRTLSYHLN